MNTQEQFLKDLQSFILSHPHYKDNEGTFTEIQTEDLIKIQIQDPDGDYEEIQITINLIP